jgi:23S rRNA pseudouridine1911/1915/1917 synthase
MNFDILYLDNHLLVVRKPAGLLSQADATGDTDLLTEAKTYLKNTFSRPGNVYLGLVHRLDRPVSGVMVLARTSKAAARLSEQFRMGSVIKEYLALVEGVCAGEGSCVDYVVRENQHTLIGGPDFPGARRAALSWQALGQTGNLSLLTVRLQTGRPHQIRAQLAHRGLPILGDKRYGASGEFDGRNLALHCYLLEFLHPVGKNTCRHTAAPPPAWRGYFDTVIASLTARS